WLIATQLRERGNLERIVREALANLPPGARILIVDDNSPDGTGEIADRLAAELPVEVLHRRGTEGLASASISGFEYVLERGAELLEIPIVFRDRRVGSSKMSRAIVLEAA